jgi:hypothetical protein
MKLLNHMQGEGEVNVRDMASYTEIKPSFVLWTDQAGDTLHGLDRCVDLTLYAMDIKFYRCKSSQLRSLSLQPSTI